MGCYWLLAAMIVATAVAAEAQSLGFGLGLDDGRRGSGAAGSPFVAATGTYSFRRLTSGFAGSAMRLRRASDSTQQDIGFVGSDFDIAAATTFCNATSCFVAKWYDQTPAAQDWSQASAGSQPPLQFSCIGALPCMMFTAVLHSMTAPTVAQTGVVSLNVVMNRSVGTGICVLPQVGGNSIKTRSGVTGLVLAGGVGSITTSSAEATWHSATGVINAAASSFAIDGSTTTGSITGATTSAGPSMQGAASTTCSITEIGFWQAYAMSAGEVAAVNADQHSYWGF